MSYLTMKQLLEAGVHFGHQTKRWNPKMKPYIFGARNGIYIIDLQQTVSMFKVAYELVRDIAAKGGKVLFVGTKRQAQSAIAEEAGRCEMPFVNQRWIGGLLTNFATVRKSLKRYNDLCEMHESGNYETTTKKEALMMERERVRLEKSMGGIRKINGVPAAVFVVDSRKESIAIKEARKLGIPVVAVVDSNCDPDEVDYIIPGNDDAIRAIKLFSEAVASACIEGRALHQESLQAASDKEAAEGAEGAEGAAGEKAATAEESPEAAKEAEEAEGPPEEKTRGEAPDTGGEAGEPKAEEGATEEPKAEGAAEKG